MPVKIPLPQLTQDFGRHSTGKEQEFRVQDYVYVPLLPQLEKLLNMPDIHREVYKVYHPSSTRYSRYEDGENYRLNPFFQQHPNALQIHLYFDEVQMCNAMSSYNHKVVFVYFTLGNLSPRFRSTYKSINLLAIFYYDQVALHVINLLLRPIIEDIKKLENGVDLHIKDEKVFKIFFFSKQHL